MDQHQSNHSELTHTDIQKLVTSGAFQQAL